MKGVYYSNNDKWGIPKPTNIWSNLKLWEDENMPNMSDDSYIIRYRKSDGRYKKYYKAFQKSSEERSKIPPSLIERLRLLI